MRQGRTHCETRHAAQAILDTIVHDSRLMRMAFPFLLSDQFATSRLDQGGTDQFAASRLDQGEAYAIAHAALTVLGQGTVIENSTRSWSRVIQSTWTVAQHISVHPSLPDTGMSSRLPRPHFGGVSVRRTIFGMRNRSNRYHCSPEARCTAARVMYSSSTPILLETYECHHR